MKYANVVMETTQENGMDRRAVPVVFYSERTAGGNAQIEYGDGMGMRIVPIETPSYVALDRLEAITQPSGHRLIIRSIRESDTSLVSPARTAPMPVSVITAALSQVMNMPDVLALVDEEGDVFTLVVFPGDTPYVRFDGAWQLAMDPDVITEYQLVNVADEAVNLFDAADLAGKQPTIFGFPLAPGETLEGIGAPAGSAQAQVGGETENLGVSAAAMILQDGDPTYPMIASADDLPEAISQAERDPEVRWYVEKRIKALGLDADLPWPSTEG